MSRSQMAAVPDSAAHPDSFPCGFQPTWLRFGAVCSCPRSQWVIQSRWEEGLTLSHTSRNDPLPPDWQLRTKQEQQCPDQVGEGCVSSQHTASSFPGFWRNLVFLNPKVRIMHWQLFLADRQKTRNGKGARDWSETAVFQQNHAWLSAGVGCGHPFGPGGFPRTDLVDHMWSLD